LKHEAVTTNSESALVDTHGDSIPAVLFSAAASKPCKAGIHKLVKVQQKTAAAATHSDLVITEFCSCGETGTAVLLNKKNKFKVDLLAKYGLLYGQTCCC
jgi:hypothetical protein